MLCARSTNPHSAKQAPRTAGKFFLRDCGQDHGAPSMMAAQCGAGYSWPRPPALGSPLRQKPQGSPSYHCLTQQLDTLCCQTPCLASTILSQAAAARKWPVGQRGRQGWAWSRGPRSLGPTGHGGTTPGQLPPAAPQGTSKSTVVALPKTGRLAGWGSPQSTQRNRELCSHT